MQTRTATTSAGSALQLRAIGESDVSVNNTGNDDGGKAGNNNESSRCESTTASGACRSAETEESKEYPTGLKFWLVMLILTASLIMGGLDTNIIGTAVPSITNEFNTVADVGWYSSGFRLCACAFQFMFGKLYKLFSVKRIFMVASGIFSLGSLLCATATTSSMFVLGRAVSGVGFAGIYGGLYTILTHILPLRRRPLFCGILGGVESVAVLAAPIIGGALTESVGWRWCFWINLPIGGVTLLLVFFLLSDPSPGETSLGLKQKIIELDLLSNLLFIPALTSLFIALSWAGTKYPWDDGRVIGPLITFAILVVVFAYNQHRLGDSAALPPRILKKRSVIAGAVFMLCTNGAINVLEYYLPTYYQIVRGKSPSESGYMMIPVVVGATIGMLLCGSGTSAIGYYAPFMLFSSAAMPVFAGLITTFDVNTSFARLVMYSGVSGFAGGIAFNTPMTAVQTVLPIEDASLGLSVMLFAQNFGPAVSIAIAQVIFMNQLATNLARVVPDIDPMDIQNNGLANVLRQAPANQHVEVLEDIGKSLSETWYLAVGLTCATLVGSVLMEWRSVKQKRA